MVRLRLLGAAILIVAALITGGLVAAGANPADTTQDVAGTNPADTTQKVCKDKIYYPTPKDTKRFQQANKSEHEEFYINETGCVEGYTTQRPDSTETP